MPRILGKKPDFTRYLEDEEMEAKDKLPDTDTAAAD
jgi:hypothetical protein